MRLCRVVLSICFILNQVFGRSFPLYACVKISLKEGNNDGDSLMVEGELSSIGGCLSIKIIIHNIISVKYAQNGFTSVEILNTDKGKQCTLSLEPPLQDSCWIQDIGVETSGQLDLRVQVWSSTYAHINNLNSIVQRRPSLIVEVLKTIWVASDLMNKKTVNSREPISGQISNSKEESCHMYDINRPSIVRCDSSSSCNLQNILYVNSTFYAFGLDQEISCEMLSTTVHRKFIKHLNKHEFIRSDLSLKSLSTDTPLFDLPGRCETRPVFLFNVPLPTYYYHAVADGAIPLAHTILRHKLRENSILAPAQGWNEKALPRFTQEIFNSLAETIAQDDVNPQHIQSFESRYGGGPIWFKDITVGFYPTIRNSNDLRNAKQYLSQAIKRDSDCESGFTDARPKVMLIIQRNGTNNVNFPGAAKEHKTRKFINIDEMIRVGKIYYDEVQVVHIGSAMSMADQAKLIGAADLFVSSFGSQWANTAFLRPNANAIMIHGYGLKEGCPHQIHAYRPVELLKDSCCPEEDHGDDFSTLNKKKKPPFFFDEHCDHLLYSFPGLVEQGHYFEMQTSRETFLPPFPLHQMYCTARNQNKTSSECENLASNIQERANKDPVWFWDYDWRTAHYYFLNQDLVVDLPKFENLVKMTSRISAL